jgi:hypothetical protein
MFLFLFVPFINCINSIIIVRAIPTVGNPTALLGTYYSFDPGNKLLGYNFGHAYGI